MDTRLQQIGKHRASFGVHLVGRMDAETSDAMSAAIWKLTEVGDPSVVVFADRLQLLNFWDFRSFAESIHSLRSLGRDVRISVSRPQLKAVLSDLNLEDACIYGEIRAEHQVLVGSPRIAVRHAS